MPPGLPAQHYQIYIDLARTSSTYMQKASEMVSQALKARGIDTDIYLDDVVFYLDPPAQLEEAIAFMKHVGLPLPEKNIQNPCPRVKYLGIWIDVETRSISMPQEKIADFLLVEWYLAQRTVPKGAAQTLVGKTIQLSACVPAARTFINHIL